MRTDAVDLIDVSDMCDALGMTPDQVRRSLREAIAAGLLAIEEVSATEVVLRGTFPDEEMTA